MSSRTNILFFTRTSDAEVRHRKLVPDARQNRQAVRAMISWVRREVLKTGIPVIELNEHAQNGATFGERLSNGIQTLFAGGADQVIIIGNDSPGISTADLAEARNLLSKGIQVVGRNQSGGAWIIGLRKELFDAEAFINLPWQTRSLGAALVELLQSQGKLTRLRDLTEIQNTHSFEEYVENSKPEGFIRVLLGILHQQTLADRDDQLADKSEPVVRPSLRAPPLAA